MAWHLLVSVHCLCVCVCLCKCELEVPVFLCVRVHMEPKYIKRSYVKKWLNSMQGSPFWKHDSRPASPEISFLLRNIHYCVYKRFPLDPILSQINPVHTFTPTSLNTLVIHCTAQLHPPEDWMIKTCIHLFITQKCKVNEKILCGVTPT
jgi:hypothetical protein